MVLILMCVIYWSRKKCLIVVWWLVVAVVTAVSLLIEFWKVRNNLKRVEETKNQTCPWFKYLQVQQFDICWIIEYYSEFPNRRACSIRFFRFSFHPACNFSCNKQKIPPCSFINLLSKKADRVEFFPNPARLFQSALLLGTSEYVIFNLGFFRRTNM